MAKNLVFDEEILYVTCGHPTTPLSGQPVRVGGLTGVATENENADGKTAVDFRTNVYTLSVKGVDDSGNVAVAAGDDLYYVDADINDGTGFLSKKVSGRYFGVALEAVTSGATATIQVLKYAGPGLGTLDIGQVITAAELADSAVTAAKLADGAVLFAKAKVFVSTEQTATGSPQNVAHGLGATPAAVLVVPTEHPGTPDTGAFDIAEGTHTSTNVVLTVTVNVKFKVLAWV
jgi:hypothetical protein